MILYRKPPAKFLTASIDACGTLNQEEMTALEKSGTPFGSVK
jgi:hypothetical protein